MPISQTRYVDITSGVGAGAVVGARSLAALLITDNNLLPPGTLITFESAEEVADYFNDTSEEYSRALFYFSWISKNITTPQQITFARWNDVATGGMIFGAPGTYVLSTFTAITSGDLTLTLGGYTQHLTGVNFGSDGSLAAVAATLTSAINAITAGGAAWEDAVVSYDATRQCFDLVSGTTDTDPVVVAAGTVTDIAGPLGWLTGAILCNGSAVQTVTAMLDAVSTASNNFGSFAFLYNLNVTLPEVESAANWSASQNNLYQFSAAVSVANAAAWSAALLAIEGCELTLSNGQYEEMIPMTILAATNYSAVNSVQNYMFQTNFNITPIVTTDAQANTYDALRVNYYGQTQSAGNLINFYQRGYMMGGSNAPVDMGIYANEQWLKDAAAAALLTMLLTLSQVSTNLAGQGQVNATLQPIIQQAITNGTISVGKTLTTAQQLYITEITGQANAWKQVQNIGYWLNVGIESEVVDDITEYSAVYTLVYSKNDVIRSVQGTHVLI